MYDFQTLNNTRLFFKGLIKQYSGKYDVLKASVSTDGKNIVWCKGWSEPYNADFIYDMVDNTHEERKILKRVPDKKSYISVHYFSDHLPVYSVLYGRDSEISCEKFYIQENNRIIGTAYTSEKKLWHISAEESDNLRRPVKYSFLNLIDKRGGIIMRSTSYQYNEKNLISKADMIQEFDIENQIMLYDNPAYKNIRLIRDSGTPPMNPECNEEYEFIYGDSGIAESFIRTDYSYGKISTHRFSIRKSLLKKYAEYGTEYFGKL